MKKICFVQHASEWPLYIPLAKELKNLGVESVFVCKTKTVHDKYKAEGFETYFISDIFNDGKTVAREAMQALDTTYGPPGINMIGDSDVQVKAFYTGNELGKQQLIAKAILFWEHFFDLHQDIYVIARETATFVTRSAYVVAKKRNIPYSWIDYGPVDDTFVLCDVDEFFIWSELDTFGKEGVRSLSAEEENKVRKHVSTFLERAEEIKPIRFIPGNLFKSIKTLLSYTLFDNKKNRREDPVRVGALLFGKKKLLKRLNWVYLTQIFFKYDKVMDEPYVYYPIYSGEEAGYLTVEHFWARNQFSLIMEVAMSLPMGYKLYVKEHPWNPGEFSFAQLRELKKIKNIRIVNPRTNGQSLIKNSGAVVVLQSFTGWEAYLYQKPAVVLGSAFYTFSSLFYRVPYITKLPAVLWQALDKKTNIYEERQAEWLWSIYGMITSGHEGMFVNKKPPYGFPDDIDNARQMASAIAKKVEEV